MVVVEKINIDYKGKTVRANKLTVSTEIPIDITVAWDNIKSPELLQFVAKGMITFQSVGFKFPKQWKQGKTYGAKMRIFGFLPFGGIHYLLLDNIDDENYYISTKEWDNSAKVWNHEVVMKDLGNGSIYYEDAIVIYAGLLTPFITAFAKIFYKHRQRRWHIVAKENLHFGK